MQAYQDAVKFRQWKESLTRNRITVNHLEELCTVHKPNGDALFILLGLDAVDSEGTPLLPTVLLRGHFVSVLTCLIEKESGQRYLLLVKQRRVASGEIFYEHPAGMCDNETDPFAIAVREVEEETGLHIHKNQLHLLNEELLYSSPGLLDEGGYFFYCEVELPASGIDTYRNRKTGEAGEHEFIRTHICTIGEAKRLIKNTNGLLHIFLYETAFCKSG